MTRRAEQQGPPLREVLSLQSPSAMQTLSRQASMADDVERLQEGESHLRLEIAHLTQQLAASRDGNNCNHEVLMQAEEAATLAKASATTLQQDLATAKSQRDAAWKELDYLQNQADGKQMDGRLPFVTQYEVLPKPEREGDRHATWRPSSHRDLANPELAAILRKVAIDNEVMVAISNSNYAMPGGMLDTWMEGVKRANVTNAMVIALDRETKDHAESMGVPAHLMILQVSEAQKGVGSNHAVSGLKFRILRPILDMGFAVLLSDVDIVTLQNPFQHLHRDCDVEGMSDGWDNATAYGYNDVKEDASMGWARYAHSMRVFVINSGLFYIRPTLASIDLMDRIIHRLDTENGWDQAIFNEVIFFPSRPGYFDPAVTRRIMDYTLFMNSKVLFKQVRHNAQWVGHRPVTVHVNYHPDKHPRMLAIVNYYVNGKQDALQPFPDGSE
ncbi:g3 [Coccomyxa viridis]|uniref:G3 protein n=1 Tax=Coccomyxa viridis TaxID=1274662 RepID=A0ABP1FEM7_9CHLO